jgi:hypothetical protein
VEAPAALLFLPAVCKNTLPRYYSDTAIRRAHRTPQVLWRLNSSGNFATFVAILLASSRSNNFAADPRRGSSSK